MENQKSEALSDFDLTEVIDGIEFIAPPRSLSHQLTSMRLLKKILDNVNYRRVLFAPVDLHINEKNRVQPDILIFGSQEELETDQLPKIVFEIILFDTIITDRIKKFNLYQSGGIDEYWLVDPETDSIEVYFLKQGEYQLHTKVVREGEVTSLALPNLKFQIEEIFN